MATKSSNSSYTGKNIKVLKGLEGIRQRFDMYVGGIETASNHLVKEALDNCVDEFINKHSTGVWIEYFENENRIVIKDDGRGLPTDIHPEEKVPTIEVLFSNLHAGKFTACYYLI